MPQDAQPAQASDGTKPVPKEGEPTNQQASSTASGQPTVPLAESYPTQTAPQGAAPVQNQQTTQPATPPPAQEPPQQVVVKEKKRGGMCNKTTCCIGSCVGCLFIIVALVLLAIFAGPTLADILNKAINPGVDVPEVETVDTTEVEDELASVAQADLAQTITISESEFNSLLKQKLSEAGEESFNLDLRTDFEENTAKIYIKLVDWMPWGVIEVTNDEQGQLTTSSLKIGPLDASSFLDETVMQEMEESGDGTTSPESLDMTELLKSLLFEEDANKVTIQEVYFRKNEMELTAVKSEEDSSNESTQLEIE